MRRRRVSTSTPLWVLPQALGGGGASEQLGEGLFCPVLPRGWGTATLDSLCRSCHSSVMSGH